MTSYAQRLADEYNARLTRTDVEWVVGANDQVYLRDKPSATSARTRELERRSEKERAIWQANHRRT